MIYILNNKMKALYNNHLHLSLHTLLCSHSSGSTSHYSFLHRHYRTYNLLYCSLSSLGFSLYPCASLPDLLLWWKVHNGCRLWSENLSPPSSIRWMWSQKVACVTIPLSLHLIHSWFSCLLIKALRFFLHL